jgi:hypothetical protein
MKYIYKFMLTVILFFPLISSTTYSQGRISTTFEASPDGKIFIYYQLNGDPQKEYNVSVVLKRTSAPSFELTPSDLSGNIGEGKFGDGSKKTIWTLKPEEKSILNGEDFYFVVNAEEVKSGGGIPWYVYVGGAALAGGTAAVLLLNKKSDNSTTTTETFPSPPGRPGQ